VFRSPLQTQGKPQPSEAAAAPQAGLQRQGVIKNCTMEKGRSGFFLLCWNRRGGCRGLGVGGALPEGNGAPNLAGGCKGPGLGVEGGLSLRETGLPALQEAVEDWGRG